MKNVIKILKDNMLGFILGAILFGGIGTVVATTILSSSVSYTNNNQTTVESALNELYNQSSYLDTYVDPRGLNTNGTGGRFSFVYWNNNFVNAAIQRNEVPTGSGLNGTFATRGELATAYSNWSNNPMYIKTTKVNEIVTGHVACLWYNNHEFCLANNYWDTDVTTTKVKLKADMEKALGITISDSNCGTSTSYAYCRLGDFYCNAYSDGYVYCGSYSDYRSCHVSGLGSARCM